MEQIPCIFCGTSNHDIAITENGYTGIKCSNCNLIYISPRPSAGEVIYRYTDEHAVLYADAQFHFRKIYRRNALSTLKKISKYSGAGSILELGSGGGAFLSMARDLGYDANGIELNPIEASWISNELKIPCETEPLSKKSFDGKKFDIVYHKDVLSHFHDPISVFNNIKDCLKPGGLLVFETGNIGDLDKRYYKFFAHFMYPDHLFFFGEKAIQLLLDQTSFECIRIYRWNIMLNLILERALWRFNDAIKQKNVDMTIRAAEENAPISNKDNKLGFKRRIRMLYRHVGAFLSHLGAIMPKDGRPLKLIIVARKK